MNPSVTLYPDQIEAKAATKGATKGIICLPTGMGKTLIQADLLAETIQENPGFNTYVINSPRILLSFQLFKEVYRFLVRSRHKANYMFVHSGGTGGEGLTVEMEAIRQIDRSIPYSKLESGTTHEAIRQFLERAKRLNVPAIFVSTYHSCDRIETVRAELGLPPIKLVVNDEAHYLVQEQFYDILHLLTYEKCFFFTATKLETASADGRGMNNEESYGPTLFQITPREAMDRGRIVRPRIHFVTTPKKLKEGAELIAAGPQLIEEAFHQHERQLVSDAKERLLDNSALGLNEKPLPAKLLVAMRGVEGIIEFLHSPQYGTLRATGVEIFAIASNEDVGNNFNGTKLDRGAFLKTLKAQGEDPTKKVIALHYDILSEGIDVSGFTGILVLRIMNECKFIQSYGRTARLHPIDRANLDTKRILPYEWQKQIKPFSYVLTPDVALGGNDQKAHIENLVGLMRDYGNDMTDHIIGDQSTTGVPDEEGLAALNEKKEAEKALQLLLDEIFADIESRDSASLKIEVFQTFASCVALGLTIRREVQTPEGNAVIIGYGQENVRMHLKNGKPLEMTPEALTALNPPPDIKVRP